MPVRVEIPRQEGNARFSSLSVNLIQNPLASNVVVADNQGNFFLNSSVVITGSISNAISASYAYTASSAVSSSYASVAASANSAISASYALTASYALNGGSGGGGSVSASNFIFSGSVTASVNTVGPIFTVVSESVQLLSLTSTGSLNHGLTTKAKGLYSHAQGFESVASESYSHAEGQSTIANGLASHAEGIDTITYGPYSHAEGEGAKTMGISSHAEGYYAVADSNYSHAEGNYSSVGTSKAYYATSVVGGIVTLSSSYGAVASFGIGNYLMLNDQDYDDNYGVAIFEIQSVLPYNSVATRIELVDSTVNTTTAIVGDVSSGIVSWTGDQHIEASYSHAEGNSYVLSAQSHGEGDNSTALGYASHAEGVSTIALGRYSHAEAYRTRAYGTGSHAEGYYARSVGDYSHAEGNSVSNGVGSHSEGVGAETMAEYSHAEGESTSTFGTGSHAEGIENITYGNYSHAEGSNSRTGLTGAFDAISVVSGLVTLSASYGDVTGQFSANSYLLLYDYEFDNNYGYFTYVISSVTFDSTYTKIQLVDTSVNTSRAYVGDVYSSTGFDSWGGNKIILGNYSHAEGISTFSSGYNTHTEGNFNLAIANHSHAEGATNRALGMYSHVEGAENITIGNYSHAEGQYSKAIGLGSHTEGQYTTASGDFSHTQGLGTVASGSYQHVQGKYNISSSEEAAFIIGNGTDSANRSNLVFASGSQFQITGSILVNGSINATGGITGSIIGTASWAINALTASSADDFTVRGTLTAQTIVAQTITSSTEYITGSSIFGSSLTNVQQMTGSLRVTGSGDHWIIGGNVGIGYAPSSYMLDVAGTMRINGRMSVESLGNSVYIGYLAGLTDTNGTDKRNVGIGYQALRQNSVGAYNVAVGSQALRLNTSGSWNNAIGMYSLYVATTANSNISIGNWSMYSTTTGGGNITIGQEAMFSNITGSYNIVIGHGSGRYTSTGNNQYSTYAIIIGQGSSVLNDGDTNEIVIGNSTFGLGSNTTSIGNSSTTMTAIYGRLVVGATSVQSSSQFQIDSTSRGFLPPRMTQAQRTAISSPATGLMVYQTDGTEGVYVYTSTGWKSLTMI